MASTIDACANEAAYSGHSTVNGYTSVHMSGSGWLILKGATGNNLQSLDAAIPVGLFTCVTGVSGSGKSTLIQDTLYPRLLYELYGTRTTWAPHAALEVPCLTCAGDLL